MNELELVRWGLARIANLHWSMGDAEGADEVLDLLCDRVAHPGLKLVVAGVASASRLFENQLEEAVELSELVLASPDASAAAVEWAVFGGALALALMGRGEEVEAVAQRGHEFDDKVDGLLRYLTAFGEVRALVLSGDFDIAAKRSADIVRITSAGQYLAWGMANVLVGTVELGRGRFADTVSRMEQTVAALTSESAASWSFPARLLLAQSYCALGRADAGAKMVAELRTRSGKHVAVFGPQLRIAEPWLAAAEGNVSTAIELALDAARLAATSKQTAIEMLALHDAVRFGDQTCPDQLAQLADEHRRPAGVGHRGARGGRPRSRRGQDVGGGAAVRADRRPAVGGRCLGAGGGGLRSVRRPSPERGGGSRGREARRGVRRAPHTGLDLAAHPLPLTVREREIANLVAAGLSNKDIADRLVVSVRTIEGHLYRACIKLDISDREDLAAMIRTGANRVMLAICAHNPVRHFSLI